MTVLHYFEFLLWQLYQVASLAMHTNHKLEQSTAFLVHIVHKNIILKRHIQISDYVDQLKVHNEKINE